MQLNGPRWPVCWAHLYPEVNFAWIETSENHRGLILPSSSGYQGSSTDLRGVSARRPNPSPPPGSREWTPLSAGSAPAWVKDTVPLLLLRLPGSNTFPAHTWSLACPRLCPPAWGHWACARWSGLWADTEGLPAQAAEGCWWHLLCETVPRVRCWSQPLCLTVPRKGSKAGPGRSWLLPGSCGSPWERQWRLVRFHAVITTLGTEKDYPSCAPFTEFAGLPRAKQMQNAAICSSCPWLCKMKK